MLLVGTALGSVRGGSSALLYVLIGIAGAITLQAYRSRFHAGEPRDPRYEPLAERLAQVEQLDVPTLMMQGGDDRCDQPASSENQAPFFTAGYQRLVFDGIGHFPPIAKPPTS